MFCAKGGALFIISIFMCVCVFRLQQLPQTLAELDDSLKLLETLQVNLAKTESQIPLIHEKFGILDKYEVPVEPAVSSTCSNIHLLTHTFYHNPNFITWFTHRCRKCVRC